MAELTDPNRRLWAFTQLTVVCPYCFSQLEYPRQPEPQLRSTEAVRATCGFCDWSGHVRFYQEQE